MRMFNNFRFQFVVTSYYSKELNEASQLYYDYCDAYPHNPKQDYLYAAIIYVVSGKRLNVTRLLRNIDKRSMSLFYKEVELLQVLQNKRFKKKESSASNVETGIGVAEGFL